MIDPNPDIEILATLAERLGYLGMAAHIRMAPPILKIPPSPLSRTGRGVAVSVTAEESLKNLSELRELARKKRLERRQKKAHPE